MTVSEEIKTVLDECQARTEKAAAMSDTIAEQETLIDKLVTVGKFELARIEIDVLRKQRAEQLALADESIASLRSALLEHGSPTH